MEKKGKQKRKIVKEKEGKAQPLMEWTVHLARKQPLKAVAVIAIIALTLAVGWVWVHPFVSFLMALFLLNVVGEFLFPVHYRVTKEGVESSSFLHERRIRWEQIRRLNVFPNSLFLSPYPKPSRLDNLRGVWVRWDGEPEGFQRLVKICQANLQPR